VQVCVRSYQAHAARRYPTRVSVEGLLVTVGAMLLLSACAAAGNTPQALSGRIHIVGSTALLPLAQKAAEAFRQKYPHVRMEVEGGGSAVGLQAVSNREAVIGTSDIYADPALYPDPDLTDHLVCIIPFTMIVHPAVGVRSLTRQQIIDSFSTGAIRNWKQVGGSDQPIVPVVRPSTSGTRATFRKYVPGGRDENGTLLQSDSSQTVLQSVAHTPGAIGYLAVPVLDSSVQQVAIDNQLPTVANSQAGRYPFWGFEHMYTLGQTEGPIDTFLNLMLTPQIQQLASHMGYIPIAGAQLASASLQRLSA
jgi:phosphate transport system substrate-binding protein